MLSSLSSVPPVWPRPRPDSFGHGHPERGDQRRDDQRHLVADAAGGVLVDDRPTGAGQVHPLAARDHRDVQATARAASCRATAPP
jgi:hypothetical protein